MNKKFELIDKIIEMEIYLYIAFMFVTKGEGIRNVLLFSAFFLWLSTVKYRHNNWILKEPVPLFFWGFIATIILSAVFSIDPIYSLTSLKNDPLKSVLIFILISTTLSDEKRLRRFLFIVLLIFAFVISTGFYSFFAVKRSMYTRTFIRHANPNKLAVDLNFLMSFLFVLFLNTKKSWFKNLILFSIIAGIITLIMTGSRGGNITFVFVLFVWSIYFIKKKSVSPKMFISMAVLIIALSWMSSLFIFPKANKKFMRLSSDAASLHRRTEIWEPLLQAVKERPVLGWGSGSDIFSMDTPFERTALKKAPANIIPAFRNPHSAFLRVLFHQGAVGLISYLSLIAAAAVTIWRSSYRSEGFQSHMLIAGAGVLIGLFVINSFVENSRLTYLSLILGIGLASRYMNKKHCHP